MPGGDDYSFKQQQYTTLCQSAARWTEFFWPLPPAQTQHAPVPQFWELRKCRILPSWGPWSWPTRQHQLPRRIRKLATKDFLRGSERRVQFTVILWMDVGESITMFFSDFIQLWFFFFDITTAIQPSVTVEILVMLFISFIYMCVIKWSSYQAQVHFTEDTLGRV